MVHQARLRNSWVILLLGLMSCTSDIAPKQYRLKHCNIKQSNGKYWLGDQPLNGMVFELNSTQTDTILKRCFKAGRPDGQWEEYYENGTKKSMRYYVNGKKEGRYLMWWPNGQKKLDYQFVNDLYHGTNLAWTIEGQLIKRMNYEGGYEAGTQTIWYNNGKIKSNYIIKNKRRYGLLGTKNCVNTSDLFYSNEPDISGRGH